MQKIPVFYSDKMSVSQLDTYSPSSQKPKALIEYWKPLEWKYIAMIGVLYPVLLKDF